MNRLLLLVLLFSPLSFAFQGHFKVKPFTVRAEKGDVYLKFQLRKTSKLNITAYLDNDENNTSFNEDILAYRRKVQSILLGKQNCNDHFCTVIDCELRPWTSWSECNKTCGGGTQTKTRSVFTQL